MADEYPSNATNVPSGEKSISSTAVKGVNETPSMVGTFRFMTSNVLAVRLPRYNLLSVIPVLVFLQIQANFVASGESATELNVPG